MSNVSILKREIVKNYAAKNKSISRMTRSVSLYVRENPSCLDEIRRSSPNLIGSRKGVCAMAIGIGDGLGFY